MKKMISIALLAILASSAAHAEGIQIESRVFHSNNRQDAGKASLIQDGYEYKADKVTESFRNSVGYGVAGVVGLDESVDAGLGLNFVRYYDGPSVQNDDLAVSAFARYYLVKNEGVKVYALTGLSQHQEDQKNKTVREDGVTTKVSADFDSILNYDLGLGSSWNLGGVDLGLEYKYSDSLIKGKKDFKIVSSGFGITEGPTKVKFKDTTLTSHELALTLAVKL